MDQITRKPPPFRIVEAESAKGLEIGIESLLYNGYRLVQCWSVIDRREVGDHGVLIYGHRHFAALELLR